MKQDKKQTAVDWLVNELGEYFPHGIGGIHLMIEQAKQIEKDQIILTKISSCNSQNCEKPFKEKLKCSCGPYFYDKTFK
jgi:hypothetical protein